MGKVGFNYDNIPEGFYDRILTEGSPIRRCWHILKFKRIIDWLPKDRESILDIGCFAGTFLSMVSAEAFPVQIGVDIIEKQIQYAQNKYSNKYRTFQYINSICDLDNLKTRFDCITLIEVIEHLTEKEIYILFESIHRLLKKDGYLFISTPNYVSTWPFLEILINRISEVDYREQHLTKFNFFSVNNKLLKIYPKLREQYNIVHKTTTHFLSPVCAALSLDFALKLSECVSPSQWCFPFGNIILLQLKKA